MKIRRGARALLGSFLFAAAACARTAELPAPSTSAVSTAGAYDRAAQFEAEIAAFEAADRRRAPEPGGIVFTGSSSIRLWPSLEQAFGVPALNRGFGGSQLPDVVHFAPRIVTPHRPGLVVLYAGDNDIAAGRTPAQLLADFEAFVRLVRASSPATRIVYVSIKPSPSRWDRVGAMREANALIASAIARDSLAAFADVFTPMLGADGRPRPELYLADSLHMTPAGYALWRERLAPFVRRGSEGRGR
jgi:lysophospholipase L1-like esterase